MEAVRNAYLPILLLFTIAVCHVAGWSIETDVTFGLNDRAVPSRVLLDLNSNLTVFFRRFDRQLGHRYEPKEHPNFALEPGRYSAVWDAPLNPQRTWLSGLIVSDLVNLPNGTKTRRKFAYSRTYGGHDPSWDMDDGHVAGRLGFDPQAPVSEEWDFRHLARIGNGPAVVCAASSAEEM